MKGLIDRVSNGVVIDWTCVRITGAKMMTRRKMNVSEIKNTCYKYLDKDVSCRVQKSVLIKWMCVFPSLTGVSNETGDWKVRDVKLVMKIETNKMIK